MSLRTVAFFDALDYAPTRAEVAAWGESDGDTAVATARAGAIEEGEGRVALRGRLQPLLALSRERTPLFPRKLRRARTVAQWLARNPNVRFVALANTTALAHARDEGDLDFFVIARHGSIWSTRLIAGAPYRLRGQLAGGAHEKMDAVCLSYFISDAGLNLSSHMLNNGDDPYFCYWFLALLPLYDDGVGQALWDANTRITAQHPHAEPWMVSPDIAVHRPRFTLPGTRLFERPAKTFQMRWFPPSIREKMNHDTSVLISDFALKFHVDDGRAAYRQKYGHRLKSLGLI
ncbi:MAG: hypothetical protein RL141_535 [Candidatus Parcubacteria bacterium]|jgi:hypothetical protein